MDNLPRIKGLEVTFSDGTTLTVPPLNLAAIETLQDRFKAWDGTVSPDTVRLVTDCTYLALKRNYPEMTRDQVAELIDLSTMQACMAAVMKVSGFGEASASGEASGMPTSAS